MLKTIWTLPIDPKSGMQGQQNNLGCCKEDNVLGYSLPNSLGLR